MRYIQKAKEIAKKKGIKFTHVCKSIGKSSGYLSEILASKRDLPEYMLEPVANALGVTVADLTGEKESHASSADGEIDTDKMLADLDNLSTERLAKFYEDVFEKLKKRFADE